MRRGSYRGVCRKSGLRRKSAKELTSALAKLREDSRAELVAREEEATSEIASLKTKVSSLEEIEKSLRDGKIALMKAHSKALSRKDELHAVEMKMSDEARKKAVEERDDALCRMIEAENGLAPLCFSTDAIPVGKYFSPVGFERSCFGELIKVRIPVRERFNGRRLSFCFILKDESEVALLKGWNRRIRLTGGEVQMHLGCGEYLILGSSELKKG